ncbi:MAG: 4Fe-4S binding protein [Candidatus Brocadiia bacterium]
MIDKLQKRVKELLEAKTIAVFIGYEKGDNPELGRPVMVTSPDQADKLVYDKTCRVMLSKYILKPEVKSLGRRGILGTLSNLRAITGLIQEKQLSRADIYVIGLSCSNKLPEVYDETIEISGDFSVIDSVETDRRIKELSALSIAERRRFWDKEFSKCIKCYACRQICPLCYCNRCIADKNQPPWIPTSPHQVGNFMWNITRAYHLAGRCINCGECQRACPVGIPLMLFNRMIYNNIKDNFGYEAGFNPDNPPPLATYNPDDKENFII